MRVGFITQWFPPEHGSAALPGLIARALSVAGCEVDVVTAYPNYPSGVLQSGWSQRWNHTERDASYVVHRTPIYVSHDARAWRRMLNYISFAASASITAVRKIRDVDVVWVHATPALPAAPAMLLRRLFGIPYILHIQDLWPDTVFASGMLPRRVDAVARPLLEWFCDRSYMHASVIGVITPGMRQLLVSRGVPEEKIMDIANWADESIFHPVDDQDGLRTDLGIQGKFVAMYAGAIGEVQGLDTLIDAAGKLAHRDDIQIIVVGDGVARERLERSAEDQELTNVHFVGPRPIGEMSEVIASADVQVVCLKDLPLYRITLPSKVQATLAAGRPLIVSAGGDAGAVVERAGAGISVEPGDAQALSSALMRAADWTATERDAAGKSGRRYYDDNFSELSGVERMVGALRRAASEKTGSAL